MYERRLREAEPHCYIPRHAEVRVLIDRAGNCTIAASARAITRLIDVEPTKRRWAMVWCFRLRAVTYSSKVFSA